MVVLIFLSSFHLRNRIFHAIFLIDFFMVVQTNISVWINLLFHFSCYMIYSCFQSHAESYWASYYSDLICHTLYLHHSVTYILDKGFPHISSSFNALYHSRGLRFLNFTMGHKLFLGDSYAAALPL